MKAKKSLGQNFLINEKIITNIVELINPSEDDLVLEIGPGRGALTKYLSKLNTSLVCVEIDRDMKQYLDNYANSRTEILYDDFLNIDLESFLSNYAYNKLFVIGNLPYYITSPILEKLSLAKIDINEMVFMVQKEVADRFCAKENSKTYGYMTLFLQYYFDVTSEIFVGKNNFSPIPNVDSTVIKLVKREIPFDMDEKKYFDFLKNAFSHKRKTLKNNLINYDWDKIKYVLDVNNLDYNVRPEQISQQVFIDIFNKINE